MPNPVTQDGLTEKQEKFVQAYLGEANGNASEAYRTAYPISEKWTANSLGVEAYRTLHHPKVSRRIDEMREKAAAKTTMSLVEAKNQLATLARHCIADPEQAMRLGPVVVRAIERLAKLENWDAPQQVQVEQVQFNLNLAGSVAQNAQNDASEAESDPETVSIPVEAKTGSDGHSSEEWT